jgi:two-component system, NtrC family, response regulator AtoC
MNGGGGGAGALVGDRRRRREATDALEQLVGDSHVMVAVKEKIARLFAHHAGGRRPPSVLITGETGTGKGRLARLIHAVGARAGGPFVEVNCAAIPDTLLEAELFGFERGAFTDARQGKPGLFQAADRGTIFLDEIGLLPEALQSKLLTVLEERTVRRLGAIRGEPVDVVVVSATNEALAALVRARRFRADLYHRLAVFTIQMPPLRARGGDVLVLADRFLTAVCEDYGLRAKTLGAAARAALAAHAWPGNVRELANVIERAALLAEGTVIEPEVLSLGDPAPLPGAPRAAAPETSFRAAVGEVERERLLAALEETGWNVSRAAVRLGISRNSIRYRLDKYGLRRDSPPMPPALAPGPPPTAAAQAIDEPRPVRALRWQRRRLALLRAVVLPQDSIAGRALTVDTLVEKIQSFGGRVLELGRSGVVGAFGLEPGEEAPRRAVLAATAIVKAAEHHARADAGEAAVRLAIHTGQLLVGHLDGVGSVDSESRRVATATLERLVTLAPAGVIALSAEAAALVERWFDVALLAAAEPPAGQSYRIASREHTGLEIKGRMSPFVGRRHELGVMHAVLETAMAGRGQIVGIIGEAGMGKTRLLREFKQSLPDKGVSYLEGHCVSYGTAKPYQPVLQMLRVACRVTDADAEPSIAHKVRGHLEAIGMDASAAPYVLRMLGVREGTEALAGLTPEAIATRTLGVLREMAFAGSRRRPLVLAIENLHWIDASTEAYFDALADGLAGASVLCVCSFRPGRRPAWMDRSYATQVALVPLSRTDSLAVVRSLPQADTLPAEVADLIVDKADGNPLFLEELTRVVVQHPEAEPPVEIPDTLQDVLHARMDRLAPDPRRLLQTAAVVGRAGPLRVLEAVWGSDDLATHFGELKRLEFVDEQLRGGEPAFVFRHVLIEEVAYASVLPAERAALHAAVGRVLEQTHAGRLHEVYGALAHHFSRADDAPQAVEYLRRFAEAAARSTAHTEAVAALRIARRHTARLPAGRRDEALADLVLRESRSLHFLGRFAENRELLAQHADLVARVASPIAASRYHLLVGLTASHLGEHDEAEDSAARAITAARQCGDMSTAGRAHVLLALGTLWSGRIRDGLAHCRDGLAVLAGIGDRSWVGQAHYVRGLLQFMRGDFDSALAAVGEADAIGVAIDDRRLRTHAAWTNGLIESSRGRWAEGVAACRQALAIAPDPFSAASAESFLGCALMEAGDASEAIERLEAAARRLERFRFRQQQGLATAWLADALLAAGDVGRAAETASRAVAISTGARYQAGAAVARRAEGRAALALGDGAAAEAALRDALARFASLEMAFETARTQLALAGALDATGSKLEAALLRAAAQKSFHALGAPAWQSRAALCRGSAITAGHESGSSSGGRAAAILGEGPAEGISSASGA